MVHHAIVVLKRHVLRTMLCRAMSVEAAKQLRLLHNYICGGTPLVVNVGTLRIYHAETLALETSYQSSFYHSALLHCLLTGCQGHATALVLEGPITSDTCLPW